MPYFDEVFGEESDRVFKEKCDLLLGRKTYEIFAVAPSLCTRCSRTTSLTR